MVRQYAQRQGICAPFLSASPPFLPLDTQPPNPTGALITGALAAEVGAEGQAGAWLAGGGVSDEESSGIEEAAAAAAMAVAAAEVAAAGAAAAEAALGVFEGRPGAGEWGVLGAEMGPGGPGHMSDEAVAADEGGAVEPGVTGVTAVTAQQQHQQDAAALANLSTAVALAVLAGQSPIRIPGVAGAGAGVGSGEASPGAAAADLSNLPPDTLRAVAEAAAAAATVVAPHLTAALDAAAGLDQGMANPAVSGAVQSGRAQSGEGTFLVPGVADMGAEPEGGKGEEEPDVMGAGDAGVLGASPQPAAMAPEAAAAAAVAAAVASSAVESLAALGAEEGYTPDEIDAVAAVGAAATAMVPRDSEGGVPLGIADALAQVTTLTPTAETAAAAGTTPDLGQPEPAADDMVASQVLAGGFLPPASAVHLDQHATALGQASGAGVGVAMEARRAAAAALPAALQAAAGVADAAEAAAEAVDPILAANSDDAADVAAAVQAAFAEQQQAGTPTGQPQAITAVLYMGMDEEQQEELLPGSPPSRALVPGPLPLPFISPVKVVPDSPQKMARAGAGGPELAPAPAGVMEEEEEEWVEVAGTGVGQPAAGAAVAWGAAIGGQLDMTVAERSNPATAIPAAAAAAVAAPSIAAMGQDTDMGDVTGLAYAVGLGGDGGMPGGQAFEGLPEDLERQLVGVERLLAAVPSHDPMLQYSHEMVDAERPHVCDVTVTVESFGGQTIIARSGEVACFVDCLWAHVDTARLLVTRDNVC